MATLDEIAAKYAGGEQGKPVSMLDEIAKKYEKSSQAKDGVVQDQQPQESKYSQETLDAHRADMFRRNERPLFPNVGRIEKTSISPTGNTEPMSIQDLKNMAGGMTQSMRGALNFVKPGLGERTLPIGGVDTNSNSYMGGSFADPVALGMGFAATPLTLPVKGAGLLGGAKAIGLDAVTGAGMGGLLGGLSDSGTAETGAAVGALANPVMRGLLSSGKGVYDWGHKALAGKQGQVISYLDSLFGNQAERSRVANDLSAMKPEVTGERLSVGALAGNPTEAAAKLAALENMARNRENTAATFKMQDLYNQDQRAIPLEAISSVGPRAEKTRTSITAPMYSAAGKEMLNADPTLLTILQGSEIAPMVRNMNESMHQGQINSLVAGRTPIPTSTSGKVTPGIDLPEWAMSPRTPDVVTPQQISGESLQRLHGEIQKRINTLTGTSDQAGKTELGQLIEADKQLKNWLRTNSKGYAEADATFRDLSQYPNQANIAQTLLSALRSPLDSERAASFAAAQRKASEAAGFKNLEGVMSPIQMKWISGIQNSLERNDATKRLAIPQQALPGQVNSLDAAVASIPTWFNQKITAAKNIIEAGGKRIDKEALDEIAKLTLDPQKMALVLKEFTPDEQKTLIRTSMEFFRKNMRPVQASALSGFLNTQE